MKLFFMIAIALVLSACGTKEYNQRVSQAYASQLTAFQQANAARATSCVNAASGCSQGESGDMCRVATLLACDRGAGWQNLPTAPRFRSSAQDFAAVAGPISSTLLGMAQVGATIFGIDRNADTTIALAESRDRALTEIVTQTQQGQIAIAGQFGGFLGQSLDTFASLPPSTQIGGDVIGGDSIGGDNIGGDNIGRDNVGGDNIGRDSAGGNIGDTAGRDNVGGDNNSDNSVESPPDDVPAFDGN